MAKRLKQTKHKGSSRRNRYQKTSYCPRGHKNVFPINALAGQTISCKCGETVKVKNLRRSA